MKFVEGKVLGRSQLLVKPKDIFARGGDKREVKGNESSL